MNRRGAQAAPPAEYTGRHAEPLKEGFCRENKAIPSRCRASDKLRAGALEAPDLHPIAIADRKPLGAAGAPAPLVSTGADKAAGSVPVRTLLPPPAGEDRGGGEGRGRFAYSPVCRRAPLERAERMRSANVVAAAVR